MRHLREGRNREIVVSGNAIDGGKREVKGQLAEKTEEQANTPIIERRRVDSEKRVHGGLSYRITRLIRSIIVTAMINGIILIHSLTGNKIILQSTAII